MSDTGVLTRTWTDTWYVHTDQELESDDFGAITVHAVAVQLPAVDTNTITAALNRGTEEGRAQVAETLFGSDVRVDQLRYGVVRNDRPRMEHLDRLSGLLIQDLPADQSLSADAREDFERRLQERLYDYPLPVFGSPPKSLQTLRSLASGAGAGAGTTLLLGELALDGDYKRAVLVLLSGGAAYFMWFTRPAQNVARRKFTHYIAKKLHTTVREEDLA